MAKGHWDRSEDQQKRNAVLAAIAKDDDVSVLDGVKAGKNGSAVDAIIGPTGM